ncbi:hypothetical protein [Streptomyces sp. NPDC056049]|uniref:hypothetical protein n=1 Tax=Streptomyces sp. NPDC056049 TaxID=3345693 RepID=UPI0035D9AC6C
MTIFIVEPDASAPPKAVVKPWAGLSATARIRPVLGSRATTDARSYRSTAFSAAGLDARVEVGLQPALLALPQGEQGPVGYVLVGGGEPRLGRGDAVGLRVVLLAQFGENAPQRGAAWTPRRLPRVASTAYGAFVPTASPGSIMSLVTWAVLL